VNDIFVFLAEWFSHLPGADWNGNRLFEIADLFGFLGAWFAGCP